MTNFDLKVLYILPFLRVCYDFVINIVLYSGFRQGVSLNEAESSASSRNIKDLHP